MTTNEISRFFGKENVIEIHPKSTTTSSSSSSTNIDGSTTTSTAGKGTARHARFARGAFGEISIGLYCDGNTRIDNVKESKSQTVQHHPTTAMSHRVRFVAIKTVQVTKATTSTNSNTTGSTDKAYSYDEIDALLMLQSHPNIVSLLAAYPTFSNDREMKIVTEYCPIDLYMACEYKRKYRHHNNSNNQLLSISTIQCIIYDILNALQYMHDTHHLIHNDLKPNNLLLSPQTGMIQLCDFGLIQQRTSTTGTVGTTKNDSNGNSSDSSTANNTTRNRTMMGITTLKYRSPEVLLGLQNIFEPSIDIYSLSIIFGELLLYPYTKFFPSPTSSNGKSQATSEMEQINVVFQLLGTPGDGNWEDYQLLPYGQHFKFTTIYPKQDMKRYIPICNDYPILHDLFQHLFVLDPQKRYTAQQALQHPWFTNFIVDCMNDDDDQHRQYRRRRLLLIEELIPKQLNEPFILPLPSPNKTNSNNNHCCNNKNDDRFAVIQEQAFDIASKRRSLLSSSD